MIVMGAGHEPLVPLRPDLPGDAQPRPALRLPGRQRRRLGALRRPGEGAPDHRLVDASPSRSTGTGRRASRRRRRSGTSRPTSGATSASAPTSSPRPLGRGTLEGQHLADCNALAARLGWLPSYPSFDRNPLDLADEADAAGLDARRARRPRAEGGAPALRRRGPRRPGNFPRVLTLWRANLLGSSSKGHEYFLRHLLGVAGRRDPQQRGGPRSPRPQEVDWRDEAPTGKLDLFTTIDFRMNGSALYSDVVLPAATWYEKHDLSSTDLHPFVHSFNPAIPPPWETQAPTGTSSTRIAESFTRLAAEAPRRAPRPRRRAAPARHARRARPAAAARCATGGTGECEPVPGKTMPKLVVGRARLRRRADKMTALGPLVEELGIGAKGDLLEAARRGRGAAAPQRRSTAASPTAARSSRRDVDVVRDDPRPLRRHQRAARASRASAPSSSAPGVPLADLAEERADERITFGDVAVQPRKVIASPEWSGIGVARAPLLAVHRSTSSAASRGGR